MATVQDLVTQALSEGGLDATNTQALAWFNERHKELVGISKAAEGGTAAATFLTKLPADAALADNVTTLSVDADVYPALVAGVIATGLRRTDQQSPLADVHEALFREGAEKMRVRTNQRYVTQTAESVQELLNEAVSAEGFEATQAQLLIWFNRRHRMMVAFARDAEGGQAAATFGALLPTDVAAAAAVSTLVVDADCYHGLISGVIADGLLRHGKDPEAAQVYEGFFREAAETMRRRQQQRYVTQTAESVQELLNEASAAQGFDASQSQLLLWFNRRHREMVAFARAAEAGQAPATFAAALPADVAAGAAVSALVVDADCFNGLVSGVIADGLLRHGKDPDLADRYELKFREAAERMRVRVEQRYLTQATDSVQALLNEAAAVAGFDATQATLLLWLNHRHREMVAIARVAEAGQAAATFAATLPAFVLAADAASSLAIDPDCYEGLVAGVVATGLRQRGDAKLAEPHEALFREAAERMRVRVQQRYLTQTTDSVQALLNEAAGADGFDATQAQLLLWLNRRHRDMVALSRSYRDRVDVGPTVVGTDFYAVANVVETYNVEVNGVPFAKARRPDVYADSQGGLVWCGPDGSGFVVEDVNATNVQGFTLVPSPETAGLSINVWAAVMPPDLVAADAVSALKVDSDCYDALVSGVIATGLMRAQKEGLAAPHEQVYAAAVEKLRRRVKRRYNTMGPAQIRLLGVNA